MLSDAESRHARGSRRLVDGDAVRLIDGKGASAVGAIVNVSRRGTVEIRVDKICLEPKPVTSLLLASALPKGDRTRLMLDMLSQLGVSVFLPLDCDHSETRFRASMMEKWKRIAVESAKQCGRTRLMGVDAEVRNPVELAKDRTSAGCRVLVCSPDGDNQGSVNDLPASATDILLLVGPEGGFSAAEIEGFDKSGCAHVQLPGNILRIETAAVTAASLFARSLNKQLPDHIPS